MSHFKFETMKYKKNIEKKRFKINNWITFCGLPSHLNYRKWFCPCKLLQDIFCLIAYFTSCTYSTKKSLKRTYRTFTFHHHKIANNHHKNGSTRYWYGSWNKTFITLVIKVNRNIWTYHFYFTFERESLFFLVIILKYLQIL